ELRGIEKERCGGIRVVENFRASPHSGAKMHKIRVSLVALLAAIACTSPSLGQQVADLQASRVIIAPPQNDVARTIKTGLAANYYGATRDTVAYNEAQQLYFLYGARHFEPIWLSEGADGKITF